MKLKDIIEANPSLLETEVGLPTVPTPVDPFKVEYVYSQTQFNGREHKYYGILLIKLGPYVLLYSPKQNYNSCDFVSLATHAVDNIYALVDRSFINEPYRKNMENKHISPPTINPILRPVFLYLKQEN